MIPTEDVVSAVSVLDVYLPRGMGQFAGKPLREVPTPALEALGVRLRDHRGARFALLVTAIRRVLESRREEPA